VRRGGTRPAIWEVVDGMRLGGGHDLAGDMGGHRRDAPWRRTRPGRQWRSRRLSAVMEAGRGRRTCSSRVAAGFHGSGVNTKGGERKGGLAIVVIFPLMTRKEFFCFHVLQIPRFPCYFKILRLWLSPWLIRDW
jgi:hypothetical protein